MSNVCLDMMECAVGRLPECCIVCGCDEDIEFLEREMEYRPPWPTAFLGLHLICWHLIGEFLESFTEWYNRELFMKFPYCPHIYVYWNRRDHRQHFSAGHCVGLAGSHASEVHPQPHNEH